jgi:hypothetical protein
MYKVLTEGNQQTDALMPLQENNQENSQAKAPKISGDCEQTRKARGLSHKRTNKAALHLETILFFKNTKGCHQLDLLQLFFS